MEKHGSFWSMRANAHTHKHAHKKEWTGKQTTRQFVDIVVKLKGKPTHPRSTCVSGPYEASVNLSFCTVLHDLFLKVGMPKMHLSWLRTFTISCQSVCVWKVPVLELWKYGSPWLNICSNSHVWTRVLYEQNKCRKAIFLLQITISLFVQWFNSKRGTTAPVLTAGSSFFFLSATWQPSPLPSPFSETYKEWGHRIPGLCGPIVGLWVWNGVKELSGRDMVEVRREMHDQIGRERV